MNLLPSPAPPREAAKSYKAPSSTASRSSGLNQIRKQKSSSRTLARRNVAKSTLSFDDLSSLFASFVSSPRSNLQPVIDALKYPHGYYPPTLPSVLELLRQSLPETLSCFLTLSATLPAARYVRRKKEIKGRNRRNGVARRGRNARA